MSVTQINLGTTANDGSGDPIRNAFAKINNNFAYISTYIPLDVNISIIGNTISTSDSNNSIVIDPYGTGILSVTKGIQVNGAVTASKGFFDGANPVIAKVTNGGGVTGTISGNTLTLNYTPPVAPLVPTDASSANIAGTVVKRDSSGSFVAGGITAQTANINDELFVVGNVITDAGILHLANNKTATESINNVFIHFCEANISGIEYKLGVTTVGLDYNDPTNKVIVLGTDVPLATPNLYTGQLTVGNITSYAGTFINPQIIGSYSQTYENPDFIIYTPGIGRTFISSTLVIRQRTVSNSIGSPGDVAGMLSVDGSNIYVCTGSHDGITAIWKYTSLLSF